GTSAARELRPPSWEEDPSPSLALRDGRCAVASTWAALLFDASSGKEIASYQDHHSSNVTCVRFHPARPSLLVTGGDDGLLCVLDTTQRTEEETLRLALNVEESVRSVSFAGEGSDLLCSFSTTEALQLWSLSERRFGERCGRLEALRTDSRLQVGDSDGNLLDVLYSDESGRAYVLAGSVEGKLLV
ncbi:Wdr89, partial [Symbiodinium microadriaticum]